MSYEAFKSAKTHPEMIVALSTLRNTNLIPAIERLIPHVKSGSVPHAVRPHVIFALQPIAAVNRNKFLSAVLPLILNATETTEIRIAAISTLFRVQPTFLELQQLIAGAIWERNQEVLNFMMTTFRVRRLLISNQNKLKANGIHSIVELRRFQESLRQAHRQSVAVVVASCRPHQNQLLPFKQPCLRLPGPEIWFRWWSATCHHLR